MLRRICSLPLLALAVTAAMFFLASLSPFDPLEAYTHGNAGALTDEQREDLIRTLNIGGPWYASWWSWVTSVCTGDLGTSRFYRMPVADVLAQRLGWSILLGALALTLTLVVSFVLGVVAGLREGGLVDRIAGFIATLLQSLPPFVLALVALLVFCLWIPIAPAGGLTDPGQPVTFAGTLRHVALPAVILGISQLPWFLLSLRASVREAIQSEAMTGTRVRGLDRRTVMLHHIVPLSLPSYFALIGSRLPELIVGSTIIESIFGWPGLGQAMVDSAKSLDFMLLSTLTLLITIAVLIGNMLADACVVLTDPRVDANV